MVLFAHSRCVKNGFFEEGVAVEGPGGEGKMFFPKIDKEYNKDIFVNKVFG